MDSITQAALGATVAGAVAGKRCNGKVLLAGALLGTLPDLDVLISYSDDVANVVKHRGFSHSLLILLPFSLMLAWLIDRFRPIADWSFARLWTLIALALITHPLLDYFTSYGTQLLWPISGYFSASSVFIIDPLYTVPLLLALVAGRVRPQRASRWCVYGLLLSSLYLGWGLTAKQLIERRAQDSLAALGLPQASIFLTPTAFNTLLWRVVVLDDAHYWEGVASVLDRDQQVRFVRQPLGHWPLAETPWQLEQLRTFANDFVSYRVEQDQLIVSDLRLGAFGHTYFQYEFAIQAGDGQWQMIEPILRQNDSIDVDLSQIKTRLLGDQSIGPWLETCQLCTWHD
ncbi:metal-dependent hydrolase [Ferrimonas pelagia]|uniref:Metal-dependent hydrolase n=1 Tax=Ferrimonas pelagia TaxID=1177826 RepID=A0ABP9FBJ9_9GAMM